MSEEKAHVSYVLRILENFGSICSILEIMLTTKKK